MKKNIKKFCILGVATILTMGTTLTAFAHEDSLEYSTWAGNTKMTYGLQVEQFGGSAYLYTSNDAELSLNGAIVYNDIVGDVSIQYNMSAGDGWGSSISDYTETPYLTTGGYCSYRVDSEDGGTSTSLDTGYGF